MQSFMRPVLVIKIAPALSFSQKFSKRTIGAAFGYGELKHANKPFCVAIVCGCSCSTHGALESFPQESGSCFESSILAALISMKDSAGYRKLHEFDGRDNQVCTHLIVKRQRQAMSCPLPEPKTAPHFRAVSQLDFKDILEHDLLFCRCLRISHAIANQPS